jgi:HSP20 family protein
MADTKMQQKSSAEPQRGIARRQENWPARDAFGFSPFSMMRRLTDEMDRAFSSSFGLGAGKSDWGFQLAIDVRERDGNLEICAELPGMSKDDVKVESTDEGVIIRGEKKREEESNEGGWHRTERSYGSFYRMIPLPEGAESDKAKAEFKNGVLEIRIPLSEPQHKSRQIPIGS